MNEKVKPAGERRWRTALAWGVALASAGLLVVAYAWRHDVHDPGIGEFGSDEVTTISEKMLTIQSTFSGLDWKDGKLYKRESGAPIEAESKQACPT